MENFLAIDVKTTGQGIRTNFMTCIGASLVNEDGETVATFEEYMAQPEGTCWEPRCENEFWSTKPELWEQTKQRIAIARPASEVMKSFREWVLKVTKDQNVTIVFDTAGFDQAWVDYNLGDLSCNYLLGKYKAPICINNYMCGAGFGDLGSSSKKAFAKKFQEFPKYNVSHDHHPVNDATCIAKNAAFVVNQIKYRKKYINADNYV